MTKSHNYVIVPMRHPTNLGCSDSIGPEAETIYKASTISTNITVWTVVWDAQTFLYIMCDLKKT